MTTQRANFLLNNINERIDTKYKKKSERDIARENKAKEIEQQNLERKQNEELQQKLQLRRVYADNQKQNVRFDEHRTRDAQRTFDRMLSRSRQRQNTH